jgi:putative PIN family toxin of toxin-antitoxin system
MKHASNMRVKKFVLDNNIWISYFVTRNELRLLQIIDKHELVVFSCDELIRELKDVLGRSHIKKYGINVPEALRVHRRLTVKFKLSYPVKNYIPKDENDNYLIALALQTSSGFITSGDSHILDEKGNLERKFKKLKILSKAEFETKFPI